jgi:lysophospholipase L1-like esterase
VQLQFGRVSIILLLPFFVSVCVSPPRGVIVLCAGDSITAEAYPHFLQRMLNTDGIRARVHNYGRSGNRSGEYLGFLGRSGETLKALRPDFILLQLGTNDVRTDLDFTTTDLFLKNMRNILAVFRSFKDRAGRPSRILIALIPPVPSESAYPFSAISKRRVIEEINPALRTLAAAENLILVDNFGIFDGRPDILPEVHPTRDGYRVLAANWYASLKPFLHGRK